MLGALRLRTYLTGMPECKLGLNDKAGALRCTHVIMCRVD